MALGTETQAQAMRTSRLPHPTTIILVATQPWPKAFFVQGPQLLEGTSRGHSGAGEGTELFNP